MHYYLETNSLYNISKIPAEKIHQCYTSYFALLELISGINDHNSFNKRQSIMRKVFRNNLYVNWSTPHQIMFQSYDITNPLNYNDPLGKWLKELVLRAIKSPDLSSFQQSPEYNDQRHGFSFFKAIDETTSQAFIRSVEDGHNRMRKAMAEHPEPISTPNGTYQLDTKADLAEFINSERTLDFTISVLVSCNFILEHIKGKINATAWEVAKSYNHYADVHLLGLTDYNIWRSANAGSPAKNDAMDLLHLIYLYSGYKRRIVSDDTIFDRVVPSYRVKFKDFEKILDSHNETK